MKYQYNSLLVLDGSSSSSSSRNNRTSTTSSTSSNNVTVVVAAAAAAAVTMLNEERDKILESGTTERSGLVFENLVVDEQIAQSTIELFRAFTSVIMDQQRLPSSSSSAAAAAAAAEASSPMFQLMSKLIVRGCPSNHFLDYVLETALAMDIFREIHLEGPSASLLEDNTVEDERQQQQQQQQQHLGGQQRVVVNDDTGLASQTTNDDVPLSLDTFGFKMRFVKRLRTLHFVNLPLSHDDVQGLMYGMDTTTSASTSTSTSTSTSQEDCEYYDTGITQLSFDGVRFVLQHEGGRSEEHDVDEEEEGEEEDETISNSNNDTKNSMVVIEELCDGLSNITTLRTLEMERCYLEDEQLDKIFHALMSNNREEEEETAVKDSSCGDSSSSSCCRRVRSSRRRSHHNLTSINVSGNHCRHLGLKAIDELLLVPFSSTSLRYESETETERPTGGIESLNLSFQFSSDDASTMTYTEQMQLGLLTDNWQHKINNRLIHLNLAGNQIHDSDMTHVGLLLRRFPSLQSLDLSFNEITVDGLNMLLTTITETESSTISEETTNVDVVNVNSKHPSSANNNKKNNKSPRLRSLNLTNNPLTSDNYASALLRLLKCLPELRSVESNVVWDNEEGGDIMNGSEDEATNKDTDEMVDRNCRIQEIRGKVQHLIDVNTAGRVLLCDSRRRSISLNVWPLVLARLARPSKKIYDPGYQPMKNKCNGMYYLLRHGPILAKPNATNDYRSTNSNQSSKLGKRKRVDPALGDYETLDDFLKAEADVSI